MTNDTAQPLPFITALCPTFRHPYLLANSLGLWRLQDYPADRRRLVILDDAGTFDRQSMGNVVVWTSHQRYASLPDKYNALLAYAPAETEALLVWEDDDVYLPGYVSAHASILSACELSKPDWVLTDYPGALTGEGGGGRFHSSLGFRRELIERLQLASPTGAAWPETRRADFDQRFIRELTLAARSRGSPWLTACESQYVYSWHTGAPHGQHAMRGADDETWYDRAADLYLAVPYVGRLVPRLDERTLRIFAELGLAEVGL